MGDTDKSRTLKEWRCDDTSRVKCTQKVSRDKSGRIKSILFTVDRDPDDLSGVLSGQIETLEDFNKTMDEDRGYVVITDTARPNRIHRQTCRYVNKESFRIKVIENLPRNGRYYWVRDLELGKIMYAASECSHCL